MLQFQLSDDKRFLTVTEACDYWYYMDLNKQDVFNLIQELTLIYNQMGV